MIYSTEKKQYKICALWIELCLFLSLWLKCVCTKYFFSGRVSPKSYFYESETMNIYVSEQIHCSRINKKRVNVVYRLINSKYIYIYILFGQEGPVHICQNPTQYPAYEHINLYIISFISYVGLKDFYHFNTIF